MLTPINPPTKKKLGLAGHCGLICHVLDQNVEGSNLAAAKNLFQFKINKILFLEVRAQEKGNTLTHCVSQSEKKRRHEEEEKEVEASFEALILCGGTTQYLCNINKVVAEKYRS